MLLGLAAGLAAVAASRLVAFPLDWTATALIVAARAAAFQAFRLDRLRWRDWTRDDDFIWHAAVASGSVMAVLAASALDVRLPWAVSAVEALLFVQCRLPATARTAPLAESPAKERKPTLIYGAGRQGRLLLDELRRPDSGFDPIGWLDDDPDKAEAVLSGLPVLGAIRALPFLTELHSVEAVFTAIPGLAGERAEQADEMARMAHVRLIIAPTLRDTVRALDRDRIAA